MFAKSHHFPKVRGETKIFELPPRSPTYGPIGCMRFVGLCLVQKCSAAWKKYSNAVLQSFKRVWAEARFATSNHGFLLGRNSWWFLASVRFHQKVHVLSCRSCSYSSTFKWNVLSWDLLQWCAIESNVVSCNFMWCIHKMKRYTLSINLNTSTTVVRRLQSTLIYRSGLVKHII